MLQRNKGQTAMTTYSDVLPTAQKIARLAIGADRFSPQLQKDWNAFEDFLLGKVLVRDIEQIKKQAELEQVHCDAAMVILSIID
jgi:hypothetical protein